MKFKFTLIGIALVASVGLYLATHTICRDDIQKMLDEYSEGLRSHAS